MKLEELTRTPKGEVYVDYRLLAWVANTAAAWTAYSSAVHVLLQELLCQLRQGEFLVVDFSFIDEISWLDQPQIAPLIPPKCAMLFVGLSTVVFNQIYSGPGEGMNSLSNSGPHDHGIIWGGTSNVSLLKYHGIQLSELQDCEMEGVRALVLNTFRYYGESVGQQKFELQHHTPIRTNGEFNAQVIISHATNFIRVCLALARLFREADGTIEKKLSESNCDRVRFLALSVRASPFAGALSLLCNCGFNIFAPGINSKILTEYAANPLLPRVAYVFVADFILGGVELRVAESFAAHRQSIVAQCICLGTYLHPQVYRSSTAIKPLVVLEDDCKELRFEIARHHRNF